MGSDSVATKRGIAHASLCDQHHNSRTLALRESFPAKLELEDSFQSQPTRPKIHCRTIRCGNSRIYGPEALSGKLFFGHCYLLSHFESPALPFLALISPRFFLSRILLSFFNVIPFFLRISMFQQRRICPCLFLGGSLFFADKARKARSG